MSNTNTATAPKLTKKQVKNWRLIREASLWAVVVIQLTFFAGAFIGGMWERNHQNEINSIKASAVVEASKTTEQK